MYGYKDGDEKGRFLVGVDSLSLEGFSRLTEIGSGGFGTVYAAIEDSLDRPVAVKVLKRGLDVTDRRRFERECRAMARVSDHPNVVTLYSTGYADDGRPFIVMELISGGSLHQSLQAKGIFGWQEVQHIGAKLAGALSHAHKAGVLHRDIKPANILMVGSEPKLTDFGIASFLDSAGATSTDIAVSLSHAPPETFENVRDERSDIYSLGSTLHTLLTGTPPFVREGDDSVNPLLKRIISDEPPAVARPDVPQDMRDLILETLAKDPTLRPQSARSIGRRLQEIDQGQHRRSAEPVGNGWPLKSSLSPGGTLLGDGHQPLGGFTGPAGQTARAPVETQIPPNPASGELASTSVHRPAGDESSLPNGPVPTATSRRSRRRNVVALVAVAVLVCLVAAGSAGVLLRTPPDEQASDAQVAGPASSEGLTTTPASADDLASGEAMPPDPTLSQSSSAPEEATPVAEEVTPVVEDTAPETIPPSETPAASTAPDAAVEEPAASARPTTVTTTGTTTTQPPPPSTQSTTSSAPQVLAPIVSILETHPAGLWVSWLPVEFAIEYDYRVTVGGQQVLVVNTTSAVGFYQYEGRPGLVCIHVKALTGAGVSSPEGSACHDPSTD